VYLTTEQRTSIVVKTPTDREMRLAAAARPRLRPLDRSAERAGSLRPRPGVRARREAARRRRIDDLVVAPANANAARRPLIAGWRRPRTSIWRSHSVGPTSLPARAGDPLDSARLRGGDR
jgi:hypothetical protein